MAKKQLSAKEVLADVNNGMSDEELMTKYGITLEGLQTVFKKLMEARILTQAMLDERSSDFNLQIDVPVSPSPRPSSPSIERPAAGDLGHVDPYYLNIRKFILDKRNYL